MDGYEKSLEQRVEEFEVALKQICEERDIAEWETYLDLANFWRDYSFELKDIARAVLGKKADEYAQAI